MNLKKGLFLIPLALLAVGCSKKEAETTTKKRDTSSVITTTKKTTTKKQTTRELQEFDVYFFDDNNQLIKTVKVKEGDTPSFVGDVPVKECNQLGYEYKFLGFEPAFAPIHGDKNYYAKFSDMQPKEEMSMFNFTSTETTCSITGLKDTTLTDITVPGYVTEIGDNAFYYSDIESITLQRGLTSIGKYAFYSCDNLESITIPNTITTIGKYAFLDFEGSIIWDSNTSIKIINEYAFSGYKGTSITIPNSVKTIDNCAFASMANVTSITIPASVTTINGNYSGNIISNCPKLTSVTVDPNNTVFDSRDNCNAIIRKSSNEIVASCKTTTFPTSVTKIGDYSFFACSGLESIIIPDTITYLGAYSFHSSRDLKYVKISENVSTVNMLAFRWCDKLESIMIPIKTTCFYTDALEGAKELNTVYYGGTEAKWSSVRFFEGNDQIKNATLYYYSDEKPTAVGKYWHYDNNNMPVAWPELTPYTINYYCDGELIKTEQVLEGNTPEWNDGTPTKKVRRLGYNYTFTGFKPSFEEAHSDMNYYAAFDEVLKSEMENYEFESTNKICRITGVKDKTITSASLPTYVTTIGQGAFKDCKKLEYVYLPINVIEIEDEAFSGCTSLKFNEYKNGYYLGSHYNASKTHLVLYKVIDDTVSSFELHSECRIIYNNAFNGCSNLENVSLTNKVKKIAYNAFIGCSKLKYKSISGAKYLGYDDNPYYALISATSTSIISCSINTECRIICESAFAGCTSLKSISLPSNVGVINSSAFVQTGLTSLTIPTTCSIIFANAIAYNDDLTSLTLHKYLQYVGYCAFSGNEKLETLVFPGYDSYTCGINNGAFSWCQSLKEVTLPDGLVILPSNTFAQCDSLETLVFPESLRIIGDGAFLNCKELNNVVIPETVYIIEDLAFSGCNAITNLIISQGIIEISKECFYNMGNLESVVIPSNILLIGPDAFSYSEKFDTVYYLGTSNQWEQIVIMDNEWLTEAAQFDGVTIYYYKEDQPTEAGNYWHYVDDVPTIWETE